MNKIEQQIERFRKLDIWKILKNILTELSPTIISMNQDQLRDGLMADGKGTPTHTGSKRSRAYVSEKIAKGIYNNAISPHWNYFNEGDFFKGFITKVGENGVLIDSLNEHDGEFITMLDESNVYGLTDENLDFLIRMMIPTMNERIRQQLGY